MPVRSSRWPSATRRGTLYRRFPTKRALVDAILEDVVAQFEALAGEVEAIPDPLEAQRAYLVRAARIHLEHAAFFQAAVSHLGVGAIVPELADRALDACARPLRRAQRARAVRTELEPMDVATMVRMLAAAGAGHGDGPAPDEALERYAGYLLDGVRRR